MKIGDQQSLLDLSSGDFKLSVPHFITIHPVVVKIFQLGVVNQPTNITILRASVNKNTCVVLCL